MKPAAWRHYVLGDLIEIKHGFAFKGKHFVDTGEEIVMTPGNFQISGGLKYQGQKEKYYNGSYSSEYLLKKGDLLVAMTDLTQDARILGSSLIIPEDNKFLHNQRLGKVVNHRSDLINLDFLYYLFNTKPVRGQLKGSATGSTVRHTSPSRIYEVNIVLPDFPVQTQIADLLRPYDDLIANDSVRIEKLEAMASIMYTKFETRVKNTCHLGDKLTVRKGKNITKATIRPGVIPVVAGGLQPAYFHDTANTTGPVITVSASGANAGYVNMYHTNVWASDCSYIDTAETPHVYFYFTLLKGKQKAITHMQKGSAQPHVYPADLERLSIPDFSDSEIEELSNMLKPIYDLIGVLNKKNEKLISVRDLLLPRLMSGEVEVNK